MCRYETRRDIGEEENKLENSAKLPEEVRRKKIVDKEEIWIINEHRVYIPNLF